MPIKYLFVLTVVALSN